jgi:hypothetical protein
MFKIILLKISIRPHILKVVREEDPKSLKTPKEDHTTFGL